MKRNKSTNDYLFEIGKDLNSLQNTYTGTGVKTSYKEFDEMTGGLQKGELIVIAARPSVGKTTFALNLVANHCKEGGTSLVISFRRSTRDLLERIISSEAEISSLKWKGQPLSGKDYERAYRAIGEVSNWSLEISDETKLTIKDICSAIRKYVTENQHENHLVLIDNLQFITPVFRQRRDLEIAEITRELKFLAMELNIPIILLSQLSRNIELRRDKRPRMTDLRDSGSIEQDADVVVFLHQDDYDIHHSEERGRVEVIIGKHRNGPTGTIELEFQREYGRFVG